MAAGTIGSGISGAMPKRRRIASKIDPNQQTGPRCAIMIALLSRAA
jgi:hypothetical protein